MPSYRGTDLFALTRDTGTVEVPNFKGYLQYSERRRTYNSFGGHVTVSTGYYTHKEYPANDDKTNSGFGIRYTVPYDVAPPVSMPANRLMIASQYSNLKGYVCYDGYLRYPGIVPQYFNHWITYIHQKGWALGLGFSFSVEYPKGAAINIEPRFTKKFDRMNETVLALWNKK